MGPPPKYKSSRHELSADILTHKTNSPFHAQARLYHEYALVTWFESEKKTQEIYWDK